MDHKFKCCNKPFIHYICIYCRKIVHKYCISKFKKEIRFLSGNQIVCCDRQDDVNTPSESDATEALERTIRELREDKVMKDKHLQKLKRDSELLMKVATEREEELEEIVRNRDEKIQELREIITELKLSLGSYTKKVTQSASTQTFVNSKTVSIGTDDSQSVKTGFMFSDSKHVDPDQQKGANVTLLKASTGSRTCKPRKLLVLSDDYGRNVGRSLYRKYGTKDFQTESIYKPGATYQQVIEDLEELCRDFTTRDHVVIIAGSNNFTTATKYPRFRDLWNRIKGCTNSNLTLVTVPYKKKSEINHCIRKFNQKLSDFVDKINRYIPGRVNIIDVNDTTGGIGGGELCKRILRITGSSQKSLSNLVFIRGETDVLETVIQHSPARTLDSDDDTSSTGDDNSPETQEETSTDSAESSFERPAGAQDM